MGIDLVSIAVYTAASVALVAVIVACLSLRSGLALMLAAVGAVVPISTIILGFFFMYLFSDL